MTKVISLRTVSKKLPRTKVGGNVYDWLADAAVFLFVRGWAQYKPNSEYRLNSLFNSSGIYEDRAKCLMNGNMLTVGAQSI